MATTAVTPETTIEHGEPLTIGMGEDHRRTIHPIVFTTGDRIRDFYAEHDGTLHAVCGRCCGKGAYGPVAIENGRCFECRGHGTVGQVHGGIQEATKRERTNYRAAQRRRAKKAAEHAESERQAAEWRTAHPELAARLAAVYETLNSDEATAIRMPAELHKFACHVRFQPLTDKQTAFATSLVDQWEAEQAEKARMRHIGTVGEKVTVTGTVAVKVPCEHRYGVSCLLIVEGTGEHTGVTVKVFSTAETVWQRERGEQVTVTGAVKAHEDYQDTPQTVIKNPRFT